MPDWIIEAIKYGVMGAIGIITAIVVLYMFHAVPTVLVRILMKIAQNGEKVVWVLVMLILGSAIVGLVYATISSHKEQQQEQQEKQEQCRTSLRNSFEYYKTGRDARVKARQMYGHNKYATDKQEVNDYVKRALERALDRCQ